MPGWGAFAEQLAKAGNNLLEHKLKPAVEKLRDFRFKNLMRWTKWKEKSDEKQEDRKKKLEKLPK